MFFQLLFCTERTKFYIKFILKHLFEMQFVLQCVINNIRVHRGYLLIILALKYLPPFRSLIFLLDILLQNEYNKDR